jgi:hypothetical protein
VPDDIIDDFYVSMSIMCSGHRLVRAGDVRAYEHSVVDRNEEFRRKERIACQAFNVHRLLWPQISRLPPLQLYCYISHKLMRWFAGLSLALGGSAAMLQLGIACGWRTAVAFAAVAAVLGTLAHAAGFKLPRRAYEVWLALLATLLGMLRSLRGHRFQTWAPAQSIRVAFSGSQLMQDLDPVVAGAPISDRAAAFREPRA